MFVNNLRLKLVMINKLNWMVESANIMFDDSKSILEVYQRQCAYKY